MTPALSTAVPLTVIVLTRDEERNLAACLESVVGWTSAIFVVDSGSTDGTLEIASRFGATVVSHPFSTHARQWQWALAELPIPTEWVLALDADQRVSPALAAHVRATLAGRPAAAGYYLRRRQVFRGRWIRHGGYYPKYLLKLFRRSAVSVDEADLVDHHFAASGTLGRLQGDLIEDNRNESSIATWTEKHNRYAALQARQELAAQSTQPDWRLRDAWGAPDARTRLIKRLWAGLPRFVRPCLYVFYRYVVRLGFLDGKEGFIFHVLQGFWYRLLVDINIDELQTSAPADVVAGRSATPGPMDGGSTPRPKPRVQDRPKRLPIR